MKNNVIVIGGAGYVGVELVSMLLAKDYNVTVFDLFIYGDNLPDNKNLKKIKGDMRDVQKVKEVIKGNDIVIHLACISNDPSFDLDPDLGKKINFDFFEPLVKISKDNGISRFIYASSSSVYGLKDEKDTNEESSLKPLTDYSKYKAMCEEVLLKHGDNNFVSTIIRPATVCGYSKRQRFDLVVNLLTNFGYNKNLITVFGGDQLRPNIHIHDMCRVYIKILETESSIVKDQIFNAGYENKPVKELAEMVREILNKDVKIVKERTDDNRSYHITSKKIKEVLNFETKKNIKNAIEDLNEAFNKKLFKDPLGNEMYFNIKRMKSINLV